MIAAVLAVHFKRYPLAAERLKTLVSSGHATLLEELDRYERDRYVEGGLAAIERLSRTAATGAVETSICPDKARMTAIPRTEDLRSRAMDNARAALEMCFDARDRLFDSPVALARFVENIVQTVNRGILKDGFLLRQADVPQKPYAPVAGLTDRYSQFLADFHRRLQEPFADHSTVDLGAWIDFNVDAQGHFFADGCGRVAKVLVAWTRMRQRRPLPRYLDRDAHYAAIDPPELERVAAYYRTLDEPASS